MFLVLVQIKKFLVQIKSYTVFLEFFHSFVHFLFNLLFIAKRSKFFLWTCDNLDHATGFIINSRCTETKNETKKNML